MDNSYVIYLGHSFSIKGSFNELVTSDEQELECFEVLLEGGVVKRPQPLGGDGFVHFGATRQQDADVVQGRAPDDAVGELALKSPRH